MTSEGLAHAALTSGLLTDAEAAHIRQLMVKIMNDDERDYPGGLPGFFRRVAAEGLDWSKSPMPYFWHRRKVSEGKQ